MNKEEALSKLELEEGAISSEISSQYQEFYNEFQMRITNAPTEHQRKLYKKKLDELTLAFETLGGKEESTEELPGIAESLPEKVEQKVSAPVADKPKMTKENALQILGLGEKFTEKELDKAYEKNISIFEEGREKAINDQLTQAYEESINESHVAHILLQEYIKKEKLDVDTLDRVVNIATYTRKRPVFLTVLCILTFMGSGLGIFYFIPQLFKPEGVTMISGIKFSALLFCLAGAVLMMRLRKVGYYFYITGQVVSIVTVFLFGYGISSGFGGFIYGLALAVNVGFIIMYGLNFKHMKRWGLGLNDSLSSKKPWLIPTAIGGTIVIIVLLIFVFTSRTAEELHGAYSAEEIHGVYTAEELHGVYTAEEIHGVYTAEELHGVYTAKEIHGVYTAEELHGVYTAEEIHGVYTAEELHGAYSAEEIHGVYTAEELHGVYTAEEIYGVYSAEDIYGVYSEEEMNGVYLNLKIKKETEKINTKQTPAKSWKSKYNWVSDFRDGIYWVKLNNKNGFTDENGNIVIPVIYDAVDWFQNTLRVRLKSEWFYIDKKGNRLDDFNHSY